MFFRKDFLYLLEKLQFMSVWQNLTLGRYYPGSSWLHQLDPRTKLVLGVAAMAMIMIVNEWAALLLWLLVLAGVIFSTQIPPHLFANNLRAFLWLFGITIAIHAFSNPAAPHWKVWGISISWPGCVTGLKYASRLALLIVIAALLSYTTIPTELTEGVERLLKPLRRWRLPVHEMAFMTSLALRFVPVIVAEAQRIQRAQMSRGAQFTGGVLQRLQALVPMLVPLFVSAFNRADELAVALAARCYDGGAPRVAYRELAFHRRDWQAALGLITISALTVAVSAGHL